MGKRRIIACAFLVIVIVWVVLPWLIPANSYLDMTVRFQNSERPTYEVRLRNVTPWPVELTEAEWFVEQNDRYSFWSQSEAPKQELALLPFQSHTFQFTIYNEYENGRQYYNGSLTVQVRAIIHVIGATSRVSLTTSYQSTISTAPTFRSTTLPR